MIAAEEVVVVDNRLSPRKWECPLWPVLMAEKWTRPQPARDGALGPGPRQPTANRFEPIAWEHGCSTDC
jgi:hypothetical protein